MEKLDKLDDSMHIGGSITSELRLFAADPYTGWVPTDKQQAELRAIADRIDAEHEAACAEAYGNGVMSVPIALDESQWVKLPVDADGETIHAGDVMVKPDIYDNRLFTVDGMTLYGDQWSVQGFAPHMLRHHAPTVEDVLREMHAELDEVTALYVGEAIDSDERDRDEARIFAEYAKRLTLAGSDAE